MMFKKAGGAGHIFLIKRGTIRDKGLAWSGWVGPYTNVALVPTSPQVMPFSVTGLASDRQRVTVVGEVMMTLDPPAAQRSFDFTISKRTATFHGPWGDIVRAFLTEQIQLPVRSAVAAAPVSQAVGMHKEFTTLLASDLKASGALASKGIVVDSCSITTIVANDNDVAETLGAREREVLITGADRARHDRQLAAAQNKRRLSEFEMETALQAEHERSALVAQQSANRETEAASDAKAIAMRLEPMAALKPAQLLGLALMDMAKSGKMGNLTITPEFLTALNAAVGKA